MKMLNTMKQRCVDFRPSARFVPQDGAASVDVIYTRAYESASALAGTQDYNILHDGILNKRTV